MGHFSSGNNEYSAGRKHQDGYKGCTYDLGLRFSSPTINLFISGEDYLNFVKDVKYYSTCKMEQDESDKP